MSKSLLILISSWWKGSTKAKVSKYLESHTMTLGICEIDLGDKLETTAHDSINFRFNFF